MARPPTWLETMLAARMDAVVVPSHKWSAPFGAVVIPPAVDTARYFPPASRAEAQRALGLPERSIYIGWVGSGDPSAFIRLLITMCREDRRVRGVIRMKPVSRRVAEIRNAGLHHRIRFVIDGDDLLWLTALDGCVTDDPDDLSARQAMACGIPVCAPEAPALRALICGDHAPLPDPATLSFAAREAALDSLKKSLLR